MKPQLSKASFPVLPISEGKDTGWTDCQRHAGHAGAFCIHIMKQDTYTNHCWNLVPCWFVWAWRSCFTFRWSSKRKIECKYHSLAKKGPVSNIRPPPYFALISCKGLKFTLKSAHLIDLAQWRFSLQFISKNQLGLRCSDPFRQAKLCWLATL